MKTKEWWEMRQYAYRPQYLQLQLILQERQPTMPTELAISVLTHPLFDYTGDSVKSYN